MLLCVTALASRWFKALKYKTTAVKTFSCCAFTALALRGFWCKKNVIMKFSRSQGRRRKRSNSVSKTRRTTRLSAEPRCARTWGAAARFLVVAVILSGRARGAPCWRGGRGAGGSCYTWLCGCWGQLLHVVMWLLILFEKTWTKCCSYYMPHVVLWAAVLLKKTIKRCSCICYTWLCGLRKHKTLERCSCAARGCLAAVFVEENIKKRWSYIYMPHVVVWAAVLFEKTFTTLFLLCSTPGVCVRRTIDSSYVNYEYYDTEWSKEEKTVTTF